MGTDIKASLNLTRRQIMCGAVAITAYGLAPKSASAQESSLVVALSYAPKYFNPNYDFDGANYYMLPNIFSTLTTYDALGNIIGDLAKSWDISPDGLVYTFHMHDNVKWHDGKPLTSADVIFSLNSLVEHKAYAQQCITGMKSAEAPDAKTIKLTLSAPNLSFLDQFSQRYGWVVLPKHIYEGTDPRKNPANTKPVGSGPFKLDEFVSGSYVGLVANPDYFRGKPTLEQLYFKFYPDISAAVVALRAGEVGFLASSPPFDSLSQLEGIKNVKFDMVGGAPFLLLWIGLNMKKKPFDDIRVRTAIAHAIDRDQINQLVYDNKLVACKAPLLKDGWAYDESAVQQSYDVNKANQLLDEAGLARKANGMRFSMRYTAFKGSIWGGREAGDVIKQQLAKVGIDVTVEFFDFSIFAQKIMKDRDYDMTWAGGPHGPDPQVFANYVKTGGNRNSMGYSDPEVDAWFDEAAKAPTKEAALPALKKMQKKIVADVARISVVEWKSPYVYQAGFSGFWWQDGGNGKIPPENYGLVKPA